MEIHLFFGLTLLIFRKAKDIEGTKGGESIQLIKLARYACYIALLTKTVQTMLDAGKHRGLDYF